MSERQVLPDVDPEPKGKGKDVWYLAERRCPACKYTLDAVHSDGYDSEGNLVEGDDTRPTDGDPILCTCCSSILVFTKDGGAQFVSRERWFAWPDAFRQTIETHAVALETLRGSTQPDGPLEARRDLGVVTCRAPDEYRAVIALENGLLVTSNPTSSPARALKELRRQREALAKGQRGMIYIKCSELEPQKWYGCVTVRAFNRDCWLTRLIGPFPSFDAGVSLLTNEALSIAGEIGFKLTGGAVVGQRTSKGKPS
jgi:hypothetical protein